jgi:hypothetical protein
MKKRLVNVVCCRGIGALGALYILLLSMSAQEPVRVDISPFGVVGLAPGETLTLKATGVSPGEGCKAQLGFDDMEGRSITRSVNVNLAPRQSAVTNYLAKSQPQGRVAVRPVAWVDRSAASGDKCLLAVYVKSEIPKETTRKISTDSNCEEANCNGISVAELNRLTLRLYVVATDRVCRAQMGFRQGNGRTSVAAKYVTLMPNHAAWLDWRSGDDDFASTDLVTPRVAFHPGDSCVASSEAFVREREPLAAEVPVHSYESSVVALAVDPESVERTIQILKNELQTTPDGIWVTNALAQAYDRHGERMRAIKLLSNQVEVSPHSVESWLLLAKLQYEQAEYRNAVASLEKCLALDPDNNTAKAAYADSLTKLGRQAEARKLFTTLLADDKTLTPAILTSYAEFLYTEGRFSEALAPVEESDARHPRCGRTLWVEAQVLEALERVPEATQSAERAVQVDSDFRAARLLLTRLYTMQGKKNEAAEQAAWLRDHAGSSYK